MFRTNCIAIKSADDYIEQLLVLNEKRRGRSDRRGQALDLSGSSHFMHTASSTPFFDAVVGKSANKTYKANSQQISDYVPEHHKAIEPPMSFNRFVAGTYKVERVADLNAPLNDTISPKSHPNLGTVRPGEEMCDFSNTDSQYERYKNLISNNYYNLNANTSAYMP